eukprot:1551436-Amphidinium_carterae.5
MACSTSRCAEHRECPIQLHIGSSLPEPVVHSALPSPRANMAGELRALLIANRVPPRNYHQVVG